MSSDTDSYSFELESIATCIGTPLSTPDASTIRSHSSHPDSASESNVDADLSVLCITECKEETTSGIEEVKDSENIKDNSAANAIEEEEELEEEQDAADSECCRKIIAEGGCKVDKDYTGPVLPFEPLHPSPEYSSTDEKHSSCRQRHSITPDFLDALLQWYADGNCLPLRYVWEIVLGAYDAFRKEDSLVEITVGEGETADVIGDVHGQYYDYLHLFSLTGHPSERHFMLMNGDLVDRGAWSVEVIVTAFAFKWLYPTRMFINRGNHETEEMNTLYGFEVEAKQKHGEMTYKLFSHVFTALPLATMISASRPPPDLPSDMLPTPIASFSPPILSSAGCKRYFVVHGGLFSRDDVTLDEIRQIPRLGCQPGEARGGLMDERMWTDPQGKSGRGLNERGYWIITFGPDVTRSWCELNNVTGIFRSHQLHQDGYVVEHDGLCTTIFSAPNYVDEHGNKGAFVRIDASGNLEFTQFDAKPHPSLKPVVQEE